MLLPALGFDEGLAVGSIWVLLGLVGFGTVVARLRVVVLVRLCILCQLTQRRTRGRARCLGSQA